MRGAYLWLLQLITGACAFFLGGIHLMLMHLDKIMGYFGMDIHEPSSWASMIDRAVRGLWLGFYIAFLAVALYHALYGLRGIIVELTPSPRAERLMTGVIIVLGVIALGMGTYVPIELFLGRGA